MKTSSIIIREKQVMEFHEVYNILCIEEDVKVQKKIRAQLSKFPNIKITFCKGDGDCRFILRTINVDMVIANLDFKKNDSLEFAQNIEKYSDISPPVVFYSQNSDWEDNFHLKQFDCSYFIKGSLTKKIIEPIIFQLLPGIERKVEVAA